MAGAPGAFAAGVFDGTRSPGPSAAGCCTCVTGKGALTGMPRSNGCSSGERIPSLTVCRRVGARVGFEGAAYTVNERLERPSEHAHTFQSFIPFLNLEHSFVIVVVAERPVRTRRPSLRMLTLKLFPRRDHPWMPQQLLRRDAEVAILLEAMIEEVLDNRRGTFWYWRAVVLDDTEQRRHRVKEVIRRLALQQLDYGTAY